ncbi:MAG: hypothetical protein RL326_775 [Pseudomonadota bacterium]|jgi:hypothetical protein
MSASLTQSRSYASCIQARDALQKIEPHKWRQQWNKGIEEFHARLDAHTEFVVTRNIAARSSSMYSIKVRNFHREESLPVRFGDPLHHQLHETFNHIVALRGSQRDVVIDAIKTGAILGHIRERDLYSASFSQRGVLFASEMPDTGSGAILVRGDLTRDTSHPEKRLILQVTWRSSIGTGGPLTFAVDSHYEALLAAKR